MTEERPRRHKAPQAPEPPQGYRQTRRGSKAAKQTKRLERQHRLFSTLDRTGRGARNVLWLVVYALAAAGFSILVLLLLATAVNTVARWTAQRRAAENTDSARRQLHAREDLLVIGVDADKASGFLAIRVDIEGNRVFGIAIPDSAFIDVPGQGFERIGEAYEAGPKVSLAAVSNYLGVPFDNYIVVPKATYVDAVKNQSVVQVPAASQTSNMSAEELEDLGATLRKIPQKDVALVPMPVTPIKLGDETYFEPRREEIADLLKSWWGVDSSQERSVVRVIVYNGVGQPGAAGEAAQVLIRNGFRVVDTKNADRFDYAKTRIVVRRGSVVQGESVKKALGVGEVTVDLSTADVTDVIVIVGKDFKIPPVDERGNQ